MVYRFVMNDQYEHISFRRSRISKAIKLLMFTTPISVSACFELDFVFRSFFIVSVSSSAFPRGKTNNLQASWILKWKKVKEKNRWFQWWSIKAQTHLIDILWLTSWFNLIESIHRIKCRIDHVTHKMCILHFFQESKQWESHGKNKYKTINSFQCSKIWKKKTSLQQKTKYAKIKLTFWIANQVAWHIVQIMRIDYDSYRNRIVMHRQWKTLYSLSCYR